VSYDRMVDEYNELECMWMKAVVSQALPSRHLPRGTEENQEKP
jgi:hypothetical protein